MNQQIYEEASEWLVELRGTRPDRLTRQRFEQWLSASPEHVRAYLEQAAIWETLSAQQPHEQSEIDQMIERGRQSSVANVLPLTFSNKISADAVPTPSRPRWRALLATAAALLLIVVSAGVYFYEPWNVYATAIGEQRSILLPDGSTIDLNARSRVRVRFDEQRRFVDLIEGQALFRVAKNKVRPFIVAVNGTRVRAVGTQFDINQRRRGLVVTVVEGTVAVSGESSAAQDRGFKRLAQLTNSPGARAPQAHASISAEKGEMLLDAGLQVTLSSAEASASSIDPPSAPHKVDVETATAWTHRRLVFETTPLEDVAAEFNRNSERAIIIRGHGLDDFHVSGAFSSTDVQPFLRFLRAQNGVEVIEEPDRIIVTRR